jgi:hypothetical protein
MLDKPRRTVTFLGGVSCRPDDGPLGLTLFGRTMDRPDELATLAFSAQAPADLPEALEDVTVEQLDLGRYLLRSGGREWIVAATAIHLHREVAAVFFRAITPRPVPWTKRLFWWVVLTIVANPAGRWLLRLLRRR